VIGCPIVENEADREDTRGSELFWDGGVGSFGVLDDCERVIELNLENVQGVLLRPVLVDLERSLCEFVADM
jgi:hypothetical protein